MKYLILLMSIASFIVYAVDKNAARRNARRVPERTLHLLALFGGWPGALLAQHILRHKSVKLPFRRVFWGTVCGNIILFTAVVLFFRQ